MSAFNWDVYKNRKSALVHLKRNCTHVDTLLETEDGSAREYVHSQVISAFGDKLNNYIKLNGTFVDNKPNCSSSSTSPRQQQQAIGRWSGRSSRLKCVKLPKVNRYTLSILVDCAYTGFIRTDLPSGGIWQVLEVADYYEMTEVIKACCAFLIKNLNRSNCVHFYHIGVKHKHQLFKSAWCKIRANFKHILAQNLRQQQEIDAAAATTTIASVPPENNNARSSSSNSSIMPADDISQTMDTTFQLTAESNQQLLPQQQQQQQQQLQLQQQVGELMIDSEVSSSLGQKHQLALLEHQRRRQNWESEIKNNNLATIKYEHLEALLMHDRLNIDHEESVWDAIKLWCNYNLRARSSKVTTLLPCMRFPRLKTGTGFSANHIWRHPLVTNCKEAQHQLAVLDRNHRDYLSGPGYVSNRDGFFLPCAPNPRQLRPRIPYSILLAIGGWQQGQPTTLIESYDVNCNLWFDCKKKIQSPLAYHGIECINNLLYICGGTDGSEILNELFTFDPIGGNCMQRPSMREARCYVSTAYLSEPGQGHLYAMGGHNGLQRMKSVERFDLTNQNWTHVQAMNVARSDASACVYESRIYIAGGLNDQVIESSVEFYNHHDNTWTFISSMITPRTSFTLLLYDGSLLAIGGNNGNERLATVEQYNFKTRLWSLHSQMRHRRSTFSAALVDETKLIVVGGYNGQTPFNQVEMYDSIGQQWTTLHKICFDRSGLKVIVVNDLPNANEYTFLGHAAATAAQSLGAGGGGTFAATSGSIGNGSNSSP